MLFIKPDWPAPAAIRAFTTLREGGVSLPPYNSLNLGTHVNDEITAVEINRQRVREHLKLPSEPFWLNQIHSTLAIPVSLGAESRTADASYTSEKKQVCVVLTADCLPVLFCDRQGSQVAATHAGWKGLLEGVIEATLSHLSCAKNDILVWLGPAIGPASYEVGEEVRDQFLAKDPQNASAFIASRPGHWMMDLYQLARLCLKKQGINTVYGGEFCTFRESDRFYSYRRDGGSTGRMATLIYIADEDELHPTVR